MRVSSLKASGNFGKFFFHLLFSSSHKIFGFFTWFSGFNNISLCFLVFFFGLTSGWLSGGFIKKCFPSLTMKLARVLLIFTGFSCLLARLMFCSRCARAIPSRISLCAVSASTPDSCLAPRDDNGATFVFAFPLS